MSDTHDNQVVIASGQFRDSTIFDPQARTALSVRDGVLEYLAAELGMDGPADRVIRVYRSPATIANAAMRMKGVPITDEHVALDQPAPGDGGYVTDAEMVDALDPATSSHVAVRNSLEIGRMIQMAVDAGKRELSLGYTADLVEHPDYDFEQRNIMPHHLAVVPQGRCGSMCAFIDHKAQQQPPQEDDMSQKIHKAFQDAEGNLNLQQVVEMAVELPEAIKAVPVDQLAALVEPLKAIIEAARAAGVEPEVEEPAEPMEATDEDEDDEDKPKFSDAAVAKLVKSATATAVKRHATVIDKAREFLPDGYQFVDKDTVQIMRDALATQSAEKFADAELDLAFKLLKPAPANYRNFGDAAAEGSLTTRIKQQLEG